MHLPLTIRGQPLSGEPGPHFPCLPVQVYYFILFFMHLFHNKQLRSSVTPCWKIQKPRIISLHKAVSKMPKFPTLLTYERVNSTDSAACFPIMIVGPTSSMSAAPLLLSMSPPPVDKFPPPHANMSPPRQHAPSWHNRGSSLCEDPGVHPISTQTANPMGPVSANDQDTSVTGSAPAE